MTSPMTTPTTTTTSQTQTNPFPFSRRFTGHNELINHLYSHQEIDLHIIRDAIEANNVDFLIEVVVFLLDRFASVGMNVEQHFQENLTPGHRIGEVAVFNYLGINKGQRSLDIECSYLFNLLHGRYTGQMINFFRILRLQTWNNGLEFKSALYSSPFYSYQSSLIQNIAIPPSRRENYHLAYAIELLFTGPQADSFIKLLALDQTFEQLENIFLPDNPDFTPLTHYRSISTLLEFLTGLIFCTGRWELFDALFGPQAQTIDLTRYTEAYPHHTFPENCLNLPFVVRRALISAGLSTAYGTFYGHLEMKMGAEMELHHPGIAHSLTNERRIELDLLIKALSHEAEMRLNLFNSLLKYFGPNFWSVEDVRATHLIALAYNDGETLQSLEKHFKINSNNMSNYTSIIKRSLINDEFYIIDLDEYAFKDPESPEIFLATILPNFVRRNVTTALQFILRSHLTTSLPSLTPSFPTNLLAAFADGQLATTEMLDFLLKHGVQPVLNSLDPRASLTPPDSDAVDPNNTTTTTTTLLDENGQPIPHPEGNFLIQIFNSTLPTEKCLNFLTTVLKHAYYNTPGSQYNDQNNNHNNNNNDNNTNNNNSNNDDNHHSSPNHPFQQQTNHLTKAQVTLSEFLSILRNMFSSIQIWKQPDCSAHVFLIQFVLDNNLIEQTEWHDFYSNPSDYVSTIVSLLRGCVDENGPGKLDLTAFSQSELGTFYDDFLTICKLLIPKDYTQQLYRLTIPERQELSYPILELLISIGHVELIHYFLQLLDIPLTTRHFMTLITNTISTTDYRNLLNFHNNPYTSIIDPTNITPIFNPNLHLLLTTLSKQDHHLSTVGFPDYYDFLTLLDEFDHCPADYLALAPEFINPHYISCPNQELKEAVFGPQFNFPGLNKGGDEGHENNNNNNNNNNIATNNNNPRASNNNKNINKMNIHNTPNSTNPTEDNYLNRFIEFDMSEFSKKQQGNVIKTTDPNQNELNNTGGENPLHLYILRGGCSIPNASGILSFEDSSALTYNTNPNRRSDNTYRNSRSNYSQQGSGNPPLDLILSPEYINGSIFQGALEWLYACWDQNNQLAVGDRSSFLSIFETFSNSFFLSEQQHRRETRLLTERSSLQDPFQAFNDNKSIRSSGDGSVEFGSSKQQHVTTTLSYNGSVGNNSIEKGQDGEPLDENQITPASLLSFFQLFCNGTLESLLISQPHGIFLPILSLFFPQHTFYNTAFLSSYALSMVPSSLLSTVWVEDYIFQGLITLAMVTDKAKVSSACAGFQSFLTTNPQICQYLIARQRCLDAQEQLSRHIMLNDYEYQYQLYESQHHLLLQQQQQQLQQQVQLLQQQEQSSLLDDGSQTISTIQTLQQLIVPEEFNPADFDLVEPLFTRESLLPFETLEEIIDDYNQNVLPSLPIKFIWNLQQFVKVYYPFKFPRRASNVLILQCLTATLASAQHYLPLLSSTEKEWKRQCQIVIELYGELDQDGNILNEIDPSLFPPRPSILSRQNLLPNFKPFLYLLRHVATYQPIPNLLLKAFYIAFKPSTVHSMVDLLDLYLFSGGKLVGNPNNHHLNHFDQIHLQEIQSPEPYSPYPAQYYLLSESIAEMPSVYAYYYLLLLRAGGYNKVDYHDIARIVATRESKMTDYILSIWQEKQHEKEQSIRDQTKYNLQWVPIITAICVGAAVVVGGAAGVYSMIFGDKNNNNRDQDRDDSSSSLDYKTKT